MFRRSGRTSSSGGGRFSWGRILIALVIAGISLITYFASSEFNPITGETQQVALSPNQEIAMGLQAAPEMAQMHGGLLQNQDAQDYLDEVCARILNNSEAGQTDWPFECHLLADPETINAFALPGGQVFITDALFERLQTEGQLAGVMAHEIGHVVARHAAEQLAEQQLAQGLSGAAVVAAYDPNNPNSGLTAAQLSALVSGLVNLKYGRDDELQSDRLGVQFMSEAGYDPRSMIDLMKILAEAGGPNRQPEFFSTHPNPENRIQNIQEAINAEYPNGVPQGLEP
ncbi:MAG: M48 family metalloprotease [Ardenticatenaceae bacterium]|nr:M48 family metalloprotease [Anaerolineales bacterium]MCB8985268.1 M48 family metalloprotease [Ardenticatenaceae bacterium]MCB8988023.1 M48 family metalloprotease [Ardenticatenaceae bacterium]